MSKILCKTCSSKGYNKQTNFDCGNYIAIYTASLSVKVFETDTFQNSGKSNETWLTKYSDSFAKTLVQEKNLKELHVKDVSMDKMGMPYNYCYITYIYLCL